MEYVTQLKGGGGGWAGGPTGRDHIFRERERGSPLKHMLSLHCMIM